MKMLISLCWQNSFEHQTLIPSVNVDDKRSEHVELWDNTPTSNRFENKLSERSTQARLIGS